MICKLSKGKGFRGLFNYLAQDAEGGGRGHVLATNLAGRTPREWAREMGTFRRLRPRLGKAVFHASLSLAPEDRQLTDAEFADLANRFLHGMGFEEAPFLVIRHQDTAHQHVHLVASRIDIQGQAIPDSGDYARAERLARQLEAAFGLRQLNNNDKKEADMDANTNTPEAAQAAVTVSNAATAAPAEPLDKKERRNFKRELLEKAYQQTISDRLAGELTFVRRKGQGLEISFRGGGKVYDDGDRLRAYGDDEAAQARRLVQLCLAKGWQAVRFSGSDAFVEAAMREALAMGLEVVAADEHQSRLLAGILQARAGQVVEVTPPEVIPVPPLKGMGERLRRFRAERDEQATTQEERPRHRRPGRG